MHGVDCLSHQFLFGVFDTMTFDLLFGILPNLHELNGDVRRDAYIPGLRILNMKDTRHSVHNNDDVCTKFMYLFSVRSYRRKLLVFKNCSVNSGCLSYT